jgi:hypothetical protein
MATFFNQDALDANPPAGVLPGTHAQELPDRPRITEITDTTAASISHTVTPGTDLLMVFSGEEFVATGFDYGATAMTLLTSRSAGANVSVWYLVNPVAGTFTITRSGAGDRAWAALNITNVGTLDPFRDTQNGTVDGTSLTVSLTSALEDLVVSVGAANLNQEVTTPEVVIWHQDTVGGIHAKGSILNGFDGTVSVRRTTAGFSAITIAATSIKSRHA